MAYTVSDFHRTYADQLKIIAGESGLPGELKDCSILDYELIPKLKDKYSQLVSYEGCLVLSSFLYSKDNPFALTDAVKYLYQKKAAALAIKNVFRIQIPESVIRYANAKNFPIFLIESDRLQFDEIIYCVKRQNELLAEKSYVTGVLKDILESELTPEEVRQNALRLNRSFRSRFFCIYAEPDDFLTPLEIGKCIENYRRSPLCAHEDFIVEFQKGILLIKSGEFFTNQDQYRFVKAVFKDVFGKERPNRTGISDIHYSLTELRDALKEAVCSAFFSVNDGYHYHYYEDLGIYRLIFSSMQNEASLKYSSLFIDPVDEYDTENKTDFLSTLSEFVRSDLDYSKTASFLGQHEQTVRYRIRRICEIIGIDPKSQQSMEQLSFATKIYLAKKMLSQQ